MNTTYLNGTTGKPFETSTLIAGTHINEPNDVTFEISLEQNTTAFTNLILNASHLFDYGDGELHHNNTTDIRLPIPASDVSHGVRFEVPFLLAVFVIGMTGNILVCLIYGQRVHRKSNASVYILNLAVGDILALTIVGFHLTEFFRATWPFLWQTDYSCAVLRYLRFVGFNVTVFTMVAIAIDRFCAIHFPMAFRVRFTLRRTRIIIVIVWLLACVAAMPTAFMFKAIYGSLGNNSVTYKGKSPFACKLVLPFGPWFSDFKAVYLNVILFYLPVLITAVLYSFIVYKVWRNGVAMATSRQTTKKSHSNAHWKTAKVLIAVFIAYTCCYVLLSTYNLVSRYFPQFYLHPMIKNVGLLLPYANSCINPIIYSFINKTFRQSVRTLICGHTDKGLRNTTSTYISSSNNHENVVSRMSQEGVTSPFEVDDNI